MSQHNRILAAQWSIGMSCYIPPPPTSGSMDQNTEWSAAQRMNLRAGLRSMWSQKVPTLRDRRGRAREMARVCFHILAHLAANRALHGSAYLKDPPGGAPPW